MAIGTKQDFKIYNEEFFGGMTETLMQDTDIFNAASNNAIRLVSARKKGDFEKESFMKEVAGLITRRDINSVAAVVDKKLEQGELVAVKINRKIGPVAQTRDAFRKIAVDPSEFSFILGKQWGKALLVDYVNTAIAALVAALSQVPAVVHDGTAGTITHSTLATGFGKFGDNAKAIRALVMHSKTYTDLMLQSIADKITNVADLTIHEGNVATLGKPVIVTDSPNLILDGTPDQYIVLGLTENAVVITESEERDIESDTITGLENLVMRIQGEYAFNLEVKGFGWDVTNGGINPTDAAIATSSNWDQAAADSKSLAGVYIYVD